MLRLLVYLSALICQAGAASGTFNVSSNVDISLCPIRFYGETYEHLYVNVTSDNLVLCFDGFFDHRAGGDCVLGPKPDSEEVDYEIDGRDAGVEEKIRETVDGTGTMRCQVESISYHRGGYTRLILADFGVQTVLYLFSNAMATLVVQVQVGGLPVKSMNFTNTPEDKPERTATPVTGCRHSGLGHEPGSEVSWDPQTCTRVICNGTAVLQTTSCGPGERCLGNGSCWVDRVWDRVCTVTGPAVIDFQGGVSRVEDRCWHVLLSLPAVPDVLVLARFQERRRTDVSFLDGVTLRLDGPGVHLHLDHGRRVRLDNSTLVLNGSGLRVHGVEVSQDRTGVSARVAVSGFTASVRFDGYTAQIRLEEPAGPGLEPGLGPGLQGLCGNASRSLAELRLPDYSSPGCETQYQDIADSSINCSQVTERCNLLKEAPFSSCTTDPQPFIAACTDTLCRYPDLDGLGCHFLEVFVRTCNLQAGAALEAWRSETGCTSYEAFCQNRTCSQHEFCGEKTVGGETRCFCRALLASQLRETGSLGERTVCRKDFVSVSLPVCLLEDKQVDISGLHLQDRTCRGQLDQETHMLTFSFNSSSCGTEVSTNGRHEIYRNTVLSQNLNQNQNQSSDIITRQDQVYVEVLCIHDQPEVRTAAFRISSSPVIQTITSGPWTYTLTMKAYTDARRTHPVESSTEVELDQKIWVQLETAGLDGDVVSVVTEACWATDQPWSDGTPRYDLVKSGCSNPADPTVQVQGNGRGTSTGFSFNMFRFSRSSGDVFLHCRLQLCVKQEDVCVPVCGGARRRRSVRSRSRSRYGALASISMVWTL